MSYGKMTTPITLVRVEYVTDNEGFPQDAETGIHHVMAYMERRNAGKAWVNRAAFSTATVMFRFRLLPGLVLDDITRVRCGTLGSEVYKVLSAEDVRGRGMYAEVLAEQYKPTRAG
jgi:hypothetical protein